jgi:putative addiction module component (TIGR02574 family)
MQIDEILKLSEAERLLAMEKIWDSLDHKKLSISKSQREELDRRINRYKAGETKFYSWDEVKKELHNKISPK